MRPGPRNGVAARAGLSRHPLRRPAGRPPPLCLAAADAALDRGARCRQARRGLDPDARGSGRMAVRGRGPAGRGLLVPECLDAGRARVAARHGLAAWRRVADGAGRFGRHDRRRPGRRRRRCGRHDQLPARGARLARPPRARRPGYGRIRELGAAGPDRGATLGAGEYRRVWGRRRPGHAVRAIGRGVQHGVDRAGSAQRRAVPPADHRERVTPRRPGLPGSSDGGGIHGGAGQAAGCERRRAARRAREDTASDRVGAGARPGDGTQPRPAPGLAGVGRDRPERPGRATPPSRRCRC